MTISSRSEFLNGIVFAEGDTYLSDRYRKMLNQEIPEHLIDLASNNLLSTYTSIKEMLKKDTIETIFCDFSKNRFSTNFQLVDHDYQQVDKESFIYVFRQGIEFSLKALLALKGISTTNKKLSTVINLTLLHYSSDELSHLLRKYVPLGTHRSVNTKDFYLLYEMLEDIKLLRKEFRALCKKELSDGVV